MASQSTRKKRALITLVLSAVATMGMLLSSEAVRADPSVSALEQQIDDAWNKLEPVLEQHNDTKEKLTAERKRLEGLKKQLDPLELELHVATARVGEFAAYLYTGGSTTELNALLSAKSPTDVTDQLVLLDQFSRIQQDKLSDVIAKRDDLTAKKKPIDDKITALAEAEKKLNDQAKTLNGQIKTLQDQVQKLYATTGGLGSLRPAPCPSTYPGGKAATAVQYACRQISKPYVWGADGPGSFDCSGLTMAAWKAAGISLPHNAKSQWNSVQHVSRANLRIGDLVFYYSDIHHVGMFVGNGWIVHASRAGVPIMMRKIDAAPIYGYGRPYGS
ncbi:cell wall-associated NlpC family hydrolase [Hamadaea flava]|uniref:NlpC/P60 family protein n=1 Tax=Hamadaea flava TaxID=1742688 RepID=A0ABV8LFZ4_9ACTN|nr:C40 family peptidase [Hamadaea flava]MCP2326134.1 cell wall-associated NlpC family hydrolase [Hamadaea flava]